MRTFKVIFLIFSAVVAASSQDLITQKPVISPAPANATDPASVIVNTVSSVFGILGFNVTNLQNAVFNLIIAVGGILFNILGLGGLFTSLVSLLAGLVNAIFDLVGSSGNTLIALTYNVLKALL